MTLDDVRLGRCKYVSLAANPAYAGRYFYMGTVRYASPIDKGNGKGQEYELTDVIGYVNDTGCAFKAPGESGSCCAKYNTCSGVGKKFDVAVGDFRGWNAVNASQFVDRQRYCSNFNTIFYQVGGAPVTPPPVTSQPVGTGDIAIVKGNPVGTNYGPFGLGIQPYTPPGGIVGLSPNQGAFSGQGASSGMGASSGTGATPVSALLNGQSPLGVSTGSGSGSGSDADSDGKTGLSASIIVVQPKNARAGLVIVSWTSVNMKPSSCKVMKDGEEFATGNEATKRDTIEKSVEYALECTTPAGETAVSKASVTI